MKEFDDKFNEKIINSETEDYNFVNQIDQTKQNTNEIEKINKEKKLKNKEKKNFMIQDRILKKKIENEKNKERLYKLSIFENFFVSLIKKITFFRENKMIYQVYLLYAFLFIIFIAAASSIKYFIMKSSFDNYMEQNYFPFIENQVIKSQNMLKVKSDEKNNKNMISTLDEEMLFMEIFSKELIKNDIQIMGNVDFNNNGNNGNQDTSNEKSYEDYLGENFKISSDLKDLITKDQKQHNLKNLIIYYYNFVPIIYQYLDSLGLNLINFYFIANSPECYNNDINNLLFKYPLEQNIYGIDIEPRNDKIYDYIVDPFIPCNNGFDILNQEEILSKIKENNWYSKLTDKINDEEINFRVFQLMKIDQIHKRKDYFIAYDKFNINDDNNNININFLLTMRMSKQNTEYPFIKYNEYNDTLFFDFLSIYNFDPDNQIIEMSNSWETMDYIFQNDYDIDDAKNIIFKNPRFLENMGFFGLKNKNSGNENINNMRILKNENNNIDAKLPFDNIILLKYYEINDIKNYYDFNYYYEADIIYYKLIYFFNNFFQYKNSVQNYLTSSETEDSTSTTNNPCSISNLDEYYYSIKSNFDYDCVYDYCFFHNCQPHDELYTGRHNSNFPNCYCIPLFCKDQNTQKNSEFENLIKDKLGIDDDDFDFSFTTNYDYFMYELETPFSQINDHFNREQFRFMCKIDFDKKNMESNKSFIAHIYSNEYQKDDIFLMYLYNLENINNIMYDLDNNNSNFVTSLIYIYISLCFVLGILIFIYVYFLCNKLITKMNKVKSIRKSIISNTNENSNIDKNKENNINNKEQKNNISNIIENKDTSDLINKDKSDNANNINLKNSENEILIREGEEKNKNRKNQKNKNENSEGDDELDELIKLINSNFSQFKIEFNLNEESNDNLSNIKRQYEEIIQVNKLKNKLLLKEKVKNFNINANISNISDNSEENENKKNKGNIEDLSVNIFCELLSLSNPKIDFSDIKTNFYYKENKDNSLYNLKNVLENMNEGNNAENVDIINIEKLQNALEHYEDNIHNYWKNYYEIQKNKDEI